VDNKSEIVEMVMGNIFVNKNSGQPDVEFDFIGGASRPANMSPSHRKQMSIAAKG
jgi:hypothetical protein